MENHIVGRNNEIRILNKILSSRKPEFMAIYGRRRVGKTFLIKEFFRGKNTFFFSITGLKTGTMKEQIKHFTTTISEVFYNGVELAPKKNWDETFELLTKAIKDIKGKIVLFFDELPWMATPKSKLLESIDYYWNQYWSTDYRIKLIVCGSSASWIINNIINNQGGLHNRLTYDIYLEPFNLCQTKQFLEHKGVKLNNKHIVELYMVLGGIPYYLDKVETGLSSTQIIEQLAFTRKSFLLREFENLFSALFHNSNAYIDIVMEIASYRYGIGQNTLLKKLGKSLAGKGGMEKLKALEDAGFIIGFKPLYHKEKGIYYRLVDNYSLFYIYWLKDIQKTLMKKNIPPGYWDKTKQKSSWKVWSGLTFESICYEHLSQIAFKLGLSPTAISSTWRYTPQKNSLENGAQIDLLFDRDDDAINICEIKYTDKPYAMTKDYFNNMKNKIETFQNVTRTKKQIFVAMITSSGISDNQYSKELISQVVNLDDLFRQID